MSSSNQPQAKPMRTAQGDVQRKPAANITLFPAQPVPYSEEAEKATLGAILIDPDAYHSIALFITGEKFYILRHQYIWEAINHVIERNDALDYLTLCDELRALGRLDEVGGAAYITQLINSVSTTTHAEVYARLVQRAHMRRCLLSAADEIKRAAFDHEMSIEQVIDTSNTALFKATDQPLTDRADQIRTVVHEYWSQLEKLVSGETSSGIPTGIKSLDNLVRGLYRREVAIIAAPSGLGKTTLALSIARNVARLGLRVSIFTYEMTREEITRRFVSMELGIPEADLKDGKLTQEQFARFVKGAPNVAAMPIRMVDDLRPMTPLKVMRRLRRHIHEAGVDLLVLDGLWLMNGDHDFRDNRVMENAYIMQRLGDMAKSMNLAIIITHQMNRSAEKRDDKRPRQQDLEYGGDKDANVVFGIYRENYYDQDCTTTDVEAIILKNRAGQQQNGRAMMRFIESRSEYV